MTNGAKDLRVGARNPAVWVNGGKKPYFHVCMIMNGRNTCKNIRIKTKTWYKLKMAQTKNKDGAFQFEVTLNDIEKWKIINKTPKTFNNVKMYASDPRYPAFNGLLRNIKICPSGN